MLGEGTRRKCQLVGCFGAAQRRFARAGQFKSRDEGARHGGSGAELVVYSVSASLGERGGAGRLLQMFDPRL